MKYKCKSNQQRIALIAALVSLGYTHSSSTLKEIETQADFENYPMIQLTDGVLDLAWPDRNQEFCTLEELLVPLKEEVSVFLNKTYTAVISEDGVKVGCQDFPLSVIDELVNAKNKVLGV
jgi:hypothetical protein